MPRLNGPFDLQLTNVNPKEIKHLSFCLLKVTKDRHASVDNSSEERILPQYKHVCQKYRIYEEMNIGNHLDEHELVFFEI